MIEAVTRDVIISEGEMGEAVKRDVTISEEGGEKRDAAISEGGGGVAEKCYFKISGMGKRQ